jgi:N-acetylglucosamine kinase-like BadF-type ATPase
MAKSNSAKTKMNFYLGFDGGGTKTECIAIDGEGRIAGSGQAGPSNPLRVGYEAACVAVEMSAAMAMASAKADGAEIKGVCAGLAGAGRLNVAEEMRSRLAGIWSGVHVMIITDAEATLETAVGDAPGIVLIAGTGSIALGRNAKGEMARAGGHGTWIGDAGSAYDIGRRAAMAVADARDFAGPPTILGEMIAATLECRGWDDVIEKVASAPAMVFPRLVPTVMQAAEDGDAAARQILNDAARELASLVLTVAGRLGMKDEEFKVARAGGVFNRSYMLDSRVDDLIARVAPRARINLLKDPPALGAARVALRLSDGIVGGHGRTKR